MLVPSSEPAACSDTRCSRRAPAGWFARERFRRCSRPGFAAYLVTATEFACPLLLPLGLAARLAALPILAMALVIQFVIGFADPAFHLTEHYYWMFVLAVIVTKAPGRFSPDHLRARRLAYSKRLGPEVSR